MVPASEHVVVVGLPALNQVAVAAIHQAPTHVVLNQFAVVVTHHFRVHAVINNVVAGSLRAAKHIEIAHGRAGYLHAFRHASPEKGAAVAPGLHAPVPAVPFPISPAQNILVAASGPALGVQMHVIYQNVPSLAVSLDVCVKIKEQQFSIP